MAASVAPSESRTFPYELPAAEEYVTVGECVHSLPQRVGRCSVCLKVFPAGTGQATSKRKAISAFVQVLPDVLWSADWSIPNVKYSISVINHSGKGDREDSDTFTFNSQFDDRGWHEFLPGDTWNSMREDGWLTDQGALYFRVSVEGDFGREQPLRPDISGTAQMWVARKFTDTVLSAEGGEEIHCHCAVLASASAVLDRMLSSTLQEGTKRRIVMREVSPDDLHTFVTFIYTDRLPKVANHHALLRLADMYELPGLSKHCVSEMAQAMSQRTVGETVRTLSRYKRGLDIECCETLLKRVKKDQALLRTFSRSLLLDDNRGAFRRDVMECILKDESVMDKVVCPLITAQALSEHL